jgi:hypothetical protein
MKPKDERAFYSTVGFNFQTEREVAICDSIAGWGSVAENWQVIKLQHGFLDSA